MSNVGQHLDAGVIYTIIWTIVSFFIGVWMGRYIEKTKHKDQEEVAKHELKTVVESEQGAKE